MRPLAFKLLAWEFLENSVILLKIVENCWKSQFCYLENGVLEIRWSLFVWNIFQSKWGNSENNSVHSECYVHTWNNELSNSWNENSNYSHVITSFLSATQNIRFQLISIFCVGFPMKCFEALKALLSSRPYHLITI